MASNRILVVDDEPAIRSFLVRVLEHEGYDVQAARDGQEALRYLELSAYDLLLTDIKMDHLDGVELLQEARNRYTDLAVILLTGHATVPSAVAALREGAFDYLLKPVKNEEIISAVAAGLHERERQQRRDRLEKIAAQFAEVVQPNEQAVSRWEPHLVIVGALRLDTAAYQAALDGELLDLTPTEFRLLLMLAGAPGAAMDYVTLVQSACGYTCERHEAREIIGTHVLNLRQKLGIDPGHRYFVESVRSVGYRLVYPDNS